MYREHFLKYFMYMTFSTVFLYAAVFVFFFLFFLFFFFVFFCCFFFFFFFFVVVVFFLFFFFLTVCALSILINLRFVLGHYCFP